MTKEMMDKILAAIKDGEPLVMERFEAWYRMQPTSDRLEMVRWVADYVEEEERLKKLSS